MRILLIHGFNVNDGGKSTIDQLDSHLEDLGHEVEIHAADYGNYGLLGVRLWPGKAIRKIRALLPDFDLVIAHSNGANFFTRAAKGLKGKDQIRALYISPALKRSTPKPAYVSHVDVFYTNRDGWVRIAGRIPRVRWGSMGAYGPTAEGYTGHDYTKSIGSHSGWFSADNAQKIAQDAHRLQIP